MTPLPTYDRRHPAPVAPVERTSPGPSIVRNRRRPIALTAALILVAALIGGASIFVWDRTGSRDGVRCARRRRRAAGCGAWTRRPC